MSNFLAIYNYNVDVGIKEIKYSEFVGLLVKPGGIISKEVTSTQDHFWNIALALSEITNHLHGQANEEYFSQLAFGFRDASMEIKHMITGMVGEVGEIMDVVKSIVLYRKNPITELTKEGISFTESFKEEVGDFCFFTIGLVKLVKGKNEFKQINEILDKLYDVLYALVEVFNLTMREFCSSFRAILISDCLKNNFSKLSKRYHKLSYSDDQAKERVDKQ